jgi:hypothetical protein
MLHFSEDFVGGFFGFWRTYGAVARFTCASTAELASEWPDALRQVAEWRAHRGEKATVLHVYFEAPPAEVWPSVAFVTGRLLVPPDARPPEVRGLHLEVAAFAPDMEQYLDLTLYHIPGDQGRPTANERGYVKGAP